MVVRESDLAVMAIENSIAGAILPNYQYIDKYDLQIIQEYYLPIKSSIDSFEWTGFK
ncbi:MAG: prephenate dehydratase domain-containing protein [Saprospiraceae bacterium]